MSKITVALFALAAALVALTCAGPLGPIPSGWQFSSDRPAYGPITCGDEGVYIVDDDTIYKYDREKWNEEYKAPSGTTFYDINFLGDAGWAVGTYANKAFMVRYDGSRWLEVDLKNDNLETLTRVFAVGAEKCWVKGWYTGSHNYLYFWDGTVLKEEAIGHVNDGAYSASDGLFYAKTNPAQSQYELVITTDAGKTWVTEKVPAAINGVDIQEVRSMAAVGDALYFLARGDSAAYKHLIIKRTGAPGEGAYEISFASPTGPDFEGLDALAFGSPARGVAVGYRTSVLYDEPRWYKEEKLSDQFGPVTADPFGGFWALGGSPWGIYYHP